MNMPVDVSQTISTEKVGAASIKPCGKCKKDFAALPGEVVCHRCTDDESLWKKLRRKGDPRNFMGYAELVGAWQRRREEVKALRYANLKLLRIQTDGWLLAELEKAKDKANWAQLQLTVILRSPEYANTAAADEIMRLRMELEAARAAVGDTVNTTVDIPETMMKRVIQLTHPDKHNNSVASNEVTAFLNTLRGKK